MLMPLDESKSTSLALHPNDPYPQAQSNAASEEHRYTEACAEYIRGSYALSYHGCITICHTHSMCEGCSWSCGHDVMLI